jgi:hypothetical protein
MNSESPCDLYQSGFLLSALYSKTSKYSKRIFEHKEGIKVDEDCSKASKKQRIIISSYWFSSEKFAADEP